MSGPATKMHDALLATGVRSDGVGLLAAEAVRDITPAALEAMDAAAEATSWESGRVKIDGATTSRTPAAILDVGGQLLWLEPKDEQALLAVLLSREIQRRSASPTPPDPSAGG